MRILGSYELGIFDQKRFYTEGVMLLFLIFYTTILIAVSFGIANCVLLEAFLTFSGLGLPIEQVTWGSLLTASRDNPSAWWMVVFPGLAIFWTVTIFNRIGEALSDK